METKNYMFKNAQVGDRVWDFVLGWGTITLIKEKSDFPLTVMFDCKEDYYIYTLEGKEFRSDLHPRLFWNEIKFEVPEKPFDLESELKKLEIVEFKNNKSNFSPYWNYCCNDIGYFINSTTQIPFVVYFTEKSINNFMSNIKDKNISKEQFFEAYKKVFG